MQLERPPLCLALALLLSGCCVPEGAPAQHDVSTLDGVHASIRNLQRSKGRLSLEFRLQRVKEGSWAFGLMGTVQIRFRTAEGALLTSRLENIYPMPLGEEFVARRSSTASESYTVEIPQGARFVTATFGETGLETTWVSVPRG